MQASLEAVRSRWVVVLLVTVGVLLLRLATAASAQAAECTDTWTGPAEGTWAAAGNWSAKHTPTETDVACIGSGKTASVTSTATAASVQGAGSLRLGGGSLTVAGVIEPSSIGSVTIESGTLSGSGTLEIGGSLTWTAEATMTGSGSTVILPGATASLETQGAFMKVAGGYHFVNEGTATMTLGGNARFKVVGGGTVENESGGTLNANSQVTWAFQTETGSPGTIVNRGTFQKTAGTGTTEVLVNFENEGLAKAASGKLSFGYSSTSGAPGSGSGGASAEWVAASGSELWFGGTYFLTGGTLSGAIGFLGQATLQGVNATGAKAAFNGSTLTVPSGTERFQKVAFQNGSGTSTVNGSGTLAIESSLTWKGEGTLTGSGSTVILPGATASLETQGAFMKVAGGYHFVNEGTATMTLGGNARFKVVGGGTVENESGGTLNANSQVTWAFQTETGSPGTIVNRGTFQKTAGTGTTEVLVNFENYGPIHETSGKLLFANRVAIKGSAATPHHACIEDPVDCATGNFTETQTDFEIGGRGVGLDLIRTYSAQAAAASSLGIFGYGWTNSFGDKLTPEESGAKQTLTEALGGTITFTKSGAAWLAPSWSQDTLSGSTEAGFTLSLPNQAKEKFNGSGRLESVTDRNGNETILAYNGSGELEMITDPSGRKVSLTYNGEGLVEKAKDPMGHEIKYTYESKNLKTVTLPGEKSVNWQFKYDASRRMTSITDGRGCKTTNEYDASNRVISQTDPVERKSAFEYSAFHTTITNKATGTVTDEWFNSNNQPMSITHGFGTAAATTESFTYTAAGLLASRTDGNGHTWSYGFDEHGNRTSETDPLEHETKWTYNEAHQVLSETKPSGDKTTIVRDANGNPETVSRPAPESKTQTVSYEYGPHGEVEAMTDPLGHAWSYAYDSYGDRKAETDPEGDKRSWTYDEDSRVISATSPRGNEEGAEAAKFTSSIERDAQGRPLKITDPLEGTTKYAYDADGNVESITDPNGRKTKFTYDADNERTKVERPNGAVEETGYDGAGQVTSQTDGNKQKTTYVRNVLEQPIEIIDPLERKTITTFDAAGNLKTKKDPDGRTTTYGYDNANQLKEISYSDGITPNATFGYDKNGNLTSMVDGTGESTYEYDQLDRLIHSKDGNGDTASWEYNLGDEPVGLTYPNGKSISRAYDKAGRLESVTDWLGHTTSFAYNKDSELRTTTFPSGTGNLDEYAFDRADRMSSVTMKKSVETLASLSYGRDKAGQVESLISKGLPGAEEESFAYDENERLKTAGAGSYEYDNANNLTKAPGTTNAFDKASQIESATGATFSFDNEGERTKRTPSSGPATTYKYDQAGNLTAVERAEEGETPAIGESFGYDGAGLLASRTVGLSTQRLTWDLSEPLPLLLSDGEDSYLYGPNGLAVEQVSSGEAPTYLHHDQLGSTRLLTNSAGEVAGTTTFAPYGAAAGKTGSATTPLGFAGQYTMGQSGLIYLRARYYDPGTAQFLTSDPAIEVTHEPYAYAGNNPLRFKDPMGLSFAEDIEGVGIPCLWCEAAHGVQELVEPGFNDFLNDAGWVLHNSFGADELDEGEGANERDASAEEVPCGEETGTQIGNARQALDEAARLVAKELTVFGSDPNSPSGGPRWVRVLALLARLLHLPR